MWLVKAGDPRVVTALERRLGLSDGIDVFMLEIDASTVLAAPAQYPRTVLTV